MTITIGSRIGTFEIIEPLGAGGMGEVYRARDTRLARDVALKVLPASVSFDPDRRARFEREARVLASLNHPNIATLHGVEESPDGLVLVMELVEGGTLADRVALSTPGRPALRVGEALTIAGQVAAALEAAHEHGIIHRDLKPANIAVRPDGTVKVLDFGLAKALAPAGDSTATAATMTATESVAVAMGPGTPAYMSPEQARGLTVDKRTDVWAFGCVLYELLAGTRPFAGDRTSDVVARILERAPDFTVLPQDTPPAIRRLLERCLEKNPQDRLRDLGDARLEVRDALARSDVQPTLLPTAQHPSRTRWWSAVALGSVGALAVALALTWWWGFLGPARASDEVLRLSVTLPSNVTVTLGPGFASSVAVSPDGRTIVVAGTASDGQRLYRRRIDQFEAVPIAGTERGSSPFFSWDGTWIGFFADGRLKRIPADGGPAVDIVTLAGFPAGASWGPDDRIVFSYGAYTPLHVVDALRGPAVVAERLGPDRTAYRPDVAPDGRTVLYESLDGWIYAFDRTTGRDTQLVRGTDPRIVDGHIVFARDTTLLAAPLDLSAHTVTGAEVPLVERVAVEGATIGGMAHYAMSRSGTLAYVPAAASYALVVRQGDGTERVLAEEQRFANPRFSPATGRFVVVATTRRANDGAHLWIHDVVSGTATRLTPGARPLWTPDGTSVTFSYTGGIYSVRADGSREPQQLLASAAPRWLVGWTPDARTLAYAAMDGTNASILALAGGEVRHVVGPGGEWGGRLSPDGRWLAYYSLNSGNFEVLVTPFPEGGTKFPVAEGTDPAWGPDGNEIYYRSANRLMAVRIDKAAGVRTVSSPRVVVEPFLPPYYDDYDIHPDGRTLVLVRPSDATPPREVAVVVNWGSELRHRLGAAD